MFSHFEAQTHNTPLWGGGTTEWWVRLVTNIAKIHLIRLASQSTCLAYGLGHLGV